MRGVTLDAYLKSDWNLVSKITLKIASQGRLLRIERYRSSPRHLKFLLEGFSRRGLLPFAFPRSKASAMKDELVVPAREPPA